MRLGIPYYGGYRWFRSENVIPIEELRRRRKRRETPAAPVTPAAPEFDRATLLAVAGEQQQERNDNDDVIA